MCYKNHSSRGNPEWGRERLCANGSEAQSIHHAWRSNVWEMIDLKFTPTATQGEEREEWEQDRRLSGKRECNWGREKERDKQHVWASNHQLTLFICCVVSARLFHHRSTVGLSEYIKTARKTETGRQTEGERKFLRETPASAFCLTFSFFHFLSVQFHFPTLSCFYRSTPPPHPRVFLSVSLSASPLRCRVGSWEQKAGDRQDKSCFLILQLSASLLSGEKTASQDREFPARCIPAQLLSLTGRQADRKEAEGDGEEDGCRDRKIGKQICGQVGKEADLIWPYRPSLWPLW